MNHWSKQETPTELTYTFTGDGGQFTVVQQKGVKGDEGTRIVNERTARDEQISQEALAELVADIASYDEQGGG